METGSCVAESMLSGAELTEVLRCLGHYIVVKLEDDATEWLLADSNVKLVRYRKSQHALVIIIVGRILTNTFDL